jgi:hypothetical protein
VAGGLVGLLNAALIVGYLLRYIQQHLYSDQPTSFVTQSVLGWFLANLVVVIFLLPVIALTPVILVAAGMRLARWLRGGRAPEPTPTRSLPLAADAATRPIQRPAAQPGAAETPLAAEAPLSNAPTEQMVASADDDGHEGRRCPTCGRAVSGGARFCRFCGRAL